MIVCKLFESSSQKRYVTIEKLNSAEAGAPDLVYLTWMQRVEIIPVDLAQSPEGIAFAKSLRKALAPQFHEEKNEEDYPEISLPITMKLEVEDNDGCYQSRLLVFGDLLEAIALHCSTAVRLRLSFTLTHHPDPEEDAQLYASYSHKSLDLDVYYDVPPAIGVKEKNPRVTGFCQETFLARSNIRQLWTATTHSESQPNFNFYDSSDDSWANRWEITSSGVLVDYKNNDASRLEKPLTNPYNDLTLVAKDGHEIGARKSFLTAGSEVFAKAFEQSWKESESHRFEMRAATPEAIMALLEFVYESRTDKAEANSSLAIEVFELAHKYGVTSLQQVMKEMFRKKHDSWIGMGNAVKVFRFVRNVEDYKNVKMKAARVINMATPAELRECSELDDLFKEDFRAAKELLIIIKELHGQCTSKKMLERNGFYVFT